MTDVAAAMGLTQLRKVERMWGRREAIARQYTAAFSQYPELEVPTVRPGVTHAWHLYILRLNLEKFLEGGGWRGEDGYPTSNIQLPTSNIRARFMEELRHRNIGASVHFIPLHLHPYYIETYGCQPEDFPVAYRQYQRVISLPIYSRMTDGDVADVIGAVGEIVEKYSAG